MLLMGQLTISMAIFNSYVSLPEGMSKCSAFLACPVVVSVAAPHLDPTQVLTVTGPKKP